MTRSFQTGMSPRRHAKLEAATVKAMERKPCKQHPTKQRFETRREAAKAAAHASKRYGDKLHAYHCLVGKGACGDWHLTSWDPPNVGLRKEAPK